MPGLEDYRVVVEHVITDVLDAGLGQMIDRVERLGEAGTKPPTRRLARKPLDDRYGLGDDGALVIEFVHGDLLVGMRVELPTALQARCNHLRIGLADPGVDRDSWSGANALVHFAHAPEGDAHAIF